MISEKSGMAGFQPCFIQDCERALASFAITYFVYLLFGCFSVVVFLDEQIITNRLLQKSHSEKKKIKKKIRPPNFFDGLTLLII